MIIRKVDVKLREFKVVDLEVLATGAKSMVAKMLYKAGDSVPSHRHPNEQSGYVISGRYRISIAGVNEVIGPGDSYSIPENVDHGFEIVEPGEVLDVFTPPRNDYL